MNNEFETTISEKGQVVIVKEIREQLGIRPNQKIVQKRQGKDIVLRPVPKLGQLGGAMRGTDKRPVQKIVDELKRGWE